MTDPGMIAVAFRDRLGRLDLDIAFDVPATGVTALFGPSGCGKTTTLRCIAGLHRAHSGRCMVRGDVWQAESLFRPAHQRDVGYVFQEPSLFPHLSVAGNLLFGAPPGSDRSSEEFSRVVTLLRIERLLERSPTKLSGGERQRVAIGRALLSRPRLLMMDEPLSALDKPTKEEIMPFLDTLHEHVGTPILYVSHDIAEVERIADHLVIIAEGKCIANGPLTKIQSDISSALALSSTPAITLDATVVDYDSKFGIARFAVNGAFFNMPMEPVVSGARRRLRICADDVSLTRLSHFDSTIENRLPATILECRDVGRSENILLLGLGDDGGGDRLLARVTRRSWARLELALGDKVFAQIKGAALVRRRG
jgi:molybdate transport system ATP-binding protein